MSYLNNQYLLLMISKCLIITTIIKLAVSDVLQSPCPNVFEYQYDNRNNLYGFIEVPSPVIYNNIVRLDVQLSVGNSVQGFNGNIALASPRSRVIEDLLQKRSIHYKLEFPYWIKIPPRITKILVNGQQICFGYPIDRSIVPVLTTINLQHTLTISIPLGAGVNNEGSFPDLSYVDDVVTRETYPYGSNPKPAQPTINFNPQTPKDPSKIYAANPFLNTNNNYPTISTFYPNQRPTDQRDPNFSPNSQNYPYYGNSQPARPVFSIGVSSYQPNSEYPSFSNSDGNTGFFANPNKPNTQFNNRDSTPLPEIPFILSTLRPSIETHIFPTQTPKDIEVEDLPTVESNLVQKPFSDVCGISVAANALLINGNRVAKGVYPWLAALFQQNDEGLKFLCGSTLISKKHVVTAAHCVRHKYKKYKPEEFWLVLGRENIQRWSNDGSQIIQAEALHVHPDYQPTTADADIAVIVLSEEAVFSRLIKPICLWTGDKDPKLIVEKKGTVAGWGKDQSGKVSTPEPRQLSFPVVSEEDCLRSNLGFREITSNRTFCAGYRNNSGPCNGDSGSGFAIERNGRWTLRGIVSMSLLGPDQTCDLQQYIVFTDTAQFMDWLLPLIR